MPIRDCRLVPIDELVGILVLQLYDPGCHPSTTGPILACDLILSYLIHSNQQKYWNDTYAFPLHRPRSRDGEESIGTVFGPVFDGTTLTFRFIGRRIVSQDCIRVVGEQ